MDAVQSLRQLSIEDLLLPILLQLVIILLAARACALLFRRLGQPSVMGEICAGLFLGPSLFGALCPDLFATIFNPVLPHVPAELSKVFIPKIFAIVSQVGLIFLLFLVGLEADFSHLRVKGRSALAISIMGVVVPFALGVGLALLIHPALEPISGQEQPIPKLGFALFLGVALSITALPVLGRIMMELNITRSRIGSITLTSAAIEDAIGWIMLATIAAVVKTGFAPWETLRMMLETVLFSVLMLGVVRPLLIRWLRWTLKKNDGDLSITALGIVLALMFSCSILTNLIGIFAIFGAFLLGAILSDQAEFRKLIHARLHDLVTAFFLPIFFTNTGLRTEIGSLHSAEMWLLCALVIGVAILAKLGACTTAARLSGFSTREATIIGILMNTRGLMELIVINVGYEMKVIPQSAYCMLVIMAVVTTLMTTPLLLWFMPGTELEAYIRSSGFLKKSE